mmetsp:Transcript_12748/g.30952  ORF Transcript_12748/g.30952 Transcript_12748/m.30952 type:complete len:282 (-) Transcript_12748:3217-4062(-)
MAAQGNPAPGNAAPGNPAPGPVILANNAHGIGPYPDGMEYGVAEQAPELLELSNSQYRRVRRAWKDSIDAGKTEFIERAVDNLTDALATAGTALKCNSMTARQRLIVVSTVRDNKNENDSLLEWEPNCVGAYIIETIMPKVLSHENVIVAAMDHACRRQQSIDYVWKGIRTAVGTQNELSPVMFRDIVKGAVNQTMNSHARVTIESWMHVQRMLHVVIYKTRARLATENDRTLAGEDTALSDPVFNQVWDNMSLEALMRLSPNDMKILRTSDRFELSKPGL